jgi:hypothetical protein
MIENISPFEEDKITKEYMSKYGIDKVRGGSYVEVELSPFQIDALQKEIWAANDLCTKCGRSGHFVKDCYAKINGRGDYVVYEDGRGNHIVYEESSDNSEESSDDYEESSDEYEEWGY